MEKLVYVIKTPCRGFKLPNGKMIDLFPYRYDSKIDFTVGQFLFVWSYFSTNVISF